MAYSQLPHHRLPLRLSSVFPIRDLPQRVLPYSAFSVAIHCWKARAVERNATIPLTILPLPPLILTLFTTVTHEK